MSHDPPFETHYSVLGLNEDTTTASIRQTYQALFKKHSSDSAPLQKLGSRTTF